MIVIANRFNLDINTPQQAESLVTSIAMGLSNVQQMPMDDTLVEHIACKFGRYLRKNGKTWSTWNYPEQPLYDAYDPVLMADVNTRNQIVVISQTGTKTPLFRTSIIGEWYSVDSNNVSLSMNNIDCSTQVQHYIPQKNATVNTFLALGDQLMKSKGIVN